MYEVIQISESFIVRHSDKPNEYLCKCEKAENSALITTALNLHDKLKVTEGKMVVTAISLCRTEDEITEAKNALEGDIDDYLESKSIASYWRASVNNETAGYYFFVQLITGEFFLQLENMGWINSDLQTIIDVIEADI